jgi:outer membrane protein OmpA-like peptidoglycan-associated protein
MGPHHSSLMAKPQMRVRSSGPGHRMSAGARTGTPIFLNAQWGALGRAPFTVQRKLKVGATGDRFEREADSVAAKALSNQTNTYQATFPRYRRWSVGSVGAEPSGLGSAVGSTGQPLDHETRRFMEERLGADLGMVRVHTDPQAARLNHDLGADAFTHHRDIFFGGGKSAAKDELTAHELAHVLQQTAQSEHVSTLGPLSRITGAAPIQCSRNGSFPVSNGGFEIDLVTHEGGVNTPPTQSGLDGYIRFVPNIDAPNSNSIAMIQIVKLTDAGGTDVDPGSMPAAQAPRGALGQPGLRTEDDALGGVEGGFFTDVHHQPSAVGPAAPQGSFLSPRYDFQPAPPGTTGVVGTTQQPAIYGSAIGGVVGQSPGFKRSNDLADIRSAVMYDAPGVADNVSELDFSFETAAVGEDTMFTYGTVLWGFGVRKGRVVSERLDVDDNASPTFGEALERHRDFYVHEPVTFYFDFDRSTLSAGEASKIDTFLPYLTRNPDVTLSLEGFADLVGGASVYNANLSLRRALAVETALLAHGVPAARIDPIIIGSGASTAATTDAGTGDQGGNPAVGADQTREANRFANRRVVLTFSHPAPAAPAPATAPAGP